MTRRAIAPITTPMIMATSLWLSESPPSLLDCFSDLFGAAVGDVSFVVAAVDVAESKAYTAVPIVTLEGHSIDAKLVGVDDGKYSLNIDSAANSRKMGTTAVV